MCVLRSDAMAYLVLLEAVLLLLVCASTQLYTQQTAAPLGSHPLLEGLMSQQQSAAALVTALLQLIVAQPQQPQQLQLYTPPDEGSSGVMRLVRTAAGAGVGSAAAPPASTSPNTLTCGSVTLSAWRLFLQRATAAVASPCKNVATPTVIPASLSAPLQPHLTAHCVWLRRLLAAATVFWIPLRTYQYIVRHSGSSSSSPEAAPNPLSDLALALLLVLAHYPAHHAQLPNGVREGLRSLQDVPAAADAEGGRGLITPASSGTPTANFSRLYDFFSHGALQQHQQSVAAVGRPEQCCTAVA